MAVQVADFVLPHLLVFGWFDIVYSQSLTLLIGEVLVRSSLHDPYLDHHVWASRRCHWNGTREHNGARVRI